MVPATERVYHLPEYPGIANQPRAVGPLYADWASVLPVSSSTHRTLSVQELVLIWAAEKEGDMYCEESTRWWAGPVAVK